LRAKGFLEDNLFIFLLLFLPSLTNTKAYMFFPCFIPILTTNKPTLSQIKPIVTYQQSIKTVL
jgi:hypothetical protein